MAYLAAMAGPESPLSKSLHSEAVLYNRQEVALFLKMEVTTLCNTKANQRTLYYSYYYLWP